MPNSPVYIVSKGRWENPITHIALKKMGVPHKIIIEENQFDDYATTMPAEDLLILPKRYQDEYDTCDDLGDTKSKGPGAARNFAWDHSIEQGADWHWVMDDNLQHFERLHENRKLKVWTGSTLLASEEFVKRYENVYIAGMNYRGFCKKDDKVPPYIKNTRIYSCLLIRNDIPYRWRGRYNEDTDLSLRVLKDGFATVQFNAFIVDKVTTQRMKGGNTKEFYDKEGTKPKSQMLEDLHPDVAKVVWKFKRWHHVVDYRPFKDIPLIRKKGLEIPLGVNEFGMTLKAIAEPKRD